MAPPSSLIGEGVPLIRAHSQKATKVTIGISDLIQGRAGGGKHVFSIWTHAWLPPSPAKHNLSPVWETGQRRRCACNISFTGVKHLKKRMVYVQGEGGCHVPRPKVERLSLAQGLMQHLSFLKVFLLLLREKMRRWDTTSEFPSQRYSPVCGYLLQYDCLSYDFRWSRKRGWLILMTDQKGMDSSRTRWVWNFILDLSPFLATHPLFIWPISPMRQLFVHRFNTFGGLLSWRSFVKTEKGGGLAKLCVHSSGIH